MGMPKSDDVVPIFSLYFKRYREDPALAEGICSGLTLNRAEEKAQLAAWTVLVNTLYNLDITKTRE